MDIAKALSSVLFGNDAASFQLDVDWNANARVTGFGWEKATEGD